MRTGNVSAVTELLLKNDHSKLIENFGSTPLHVAAWVGRPEILKMFLNTESEDSKASFWTKADVNKRQNRDESRVIERFNVNVKDNHFHTPLHEAAYFSVDDSHFKVTEILLKNGADVYARSKLGKSPMHFLVRKSNLKVIKLLLDYEANNNSKDEDGETPLFEAVRFDNSEIVKLLIDNNSYVNTSSTKNGLTPLHVANQCSQTASNIENRRNTIEEWS